MKKFIIAVIVLLAIIFIFMGVMHRRYDYNTYNGYNSAPAYHQSIGSGIVHSAVKGAVEGYVAGKVINHGMRRAQARQYNSYNSGYSNHYSTGHSTHFGHRR